MTIHAPGWLAWIVIAMVIVGPIFATVIVVQNSREHDSRVHADCVESQRRYDTLRALVLVPTRDPAQREQLLKTLGTRPHCP